MRGMNMSNIAAMEQPRMLANTLAQNADPKFQMSRGELINDDNQVKETALPAPGDWESEIGHQNISSSIITVMHGPVNS
ncbi:peroxisome biogenesis protein [Trifolium repens]|nr:peroxisome biogenesis protein [Trifolium repens]